MPLSLDFPCLLYSALIRCNKSFYQSNYRGIMAKRGQTRTFSKEEKKQAEQLYSRGFTIKDLEEFFDCTEHVIRREVGIENLKKAKKNSNSKLVNRAYELAMDGDKTMLIFLIKTQCKWSEQYHELDYKAEIEKQLIRFKQEIGYSEVTAAPLEIHLHETKTRDADRNEIEIYQPPKLGMGDTE